MKMKVRYFGKEFEVRKLISYGDIVRVETDEFTFEGEIEIHILDNQMTVWPHKGNIIIDGNIHMTAIFNSDGYPIHGKVYGGTREIVGTFKYGKFIKTA